MKVAPILTAVSVLGALGLIWSQSRGPEKSVDRGPSGIDFVIPGDYAVLELGESTMEQAAGALIGPVRNRAKTAVRFTRSGDRIQILADPLEETLEEQLMSRHGTVRRVVWRDSILVRLERARTRGDFQVQGLPPPVSRNPYH